MADSKRQLTIKTGAVRRLSKELVLYEKERDAEVVKVERLKASEADSHDIKHAEDVLAEASMMIPDNKQRLTNSLQELLQLKDDTEAELSETEEWRTALSVAEEAQKLLQK